MNKPLELTIYEYDREQYGYADPVGWIYPDMDVDYFVEQKHLTEAELCAEYEAARCDAMIQYATGRCWQPLGYTWPMDPESIHNRERTLLRFASRSHYFEATEPESDTE